MKSVGLSYFFRPNKEAKRRRSRGYVEGGRHSVGKKMSQDGAVEFISAFSTI